MDTAVQVLNGTPVVISISSSLEGYLNQPQSFWSSGLQSWQNNLLRWLRSKNKNFVNISVFILWEFAVRWPVWSHSPFFLFAFLTAYYVKPVYLHKERPNKRFMHSIQYLYSGLEEVSSWQSAWRWCKLDRRWILVPANPCKDIGAQEEGRNDLSQLRQSLKHLYISLIIHLFMFNLKFYVLVM